MNFQPDLAAKVMAGEKTVDDQRGPLFRVLGFLFGWCGPWLAARGHGRSPWRGGA